MNALGILKLVDMTLGILARIPEAAAEAEDLRGKIRAFIAEGRDPTPEEWDTLSAEIDNKLAELDALAARQAP